MLGNEEKIRKMIDELGIILKGVDIVDPQTSPMIDKYAEELYNIRNRHGVTMSEAKAQLMNPNVYGAMMVHMGYADGLIAGVAQHYPDTLRPALQILHTKKGVSKVSGLYMLIIKQQIFFFADTTVNIEPDAETLAEIAMCSADVAKRFNIEPRIAMLSFSNFGSVKHKLVDKVQKAVEIVKEKAPHLMIDGEMQADTAVVPEILKNTYSFNMLKEPANVLIFPDLQSGNIAYKLLQRLGGADAIGPILMGVKKPVHVLERGCEVDEIVNMAAICVVDAQELSKKR
jgi:malate dehydrogenase (oxaloacetate-decarboxylating)(NADP+)